MVGGLNDYMLVSYTWEGLLFEEGVGVKISGSISGMEVMLFGSMSFVCDTEILNEVRGHEGCVLVLNA